ncbi:MAG: hypothetical protein RIS35_3310 [Pseudomonadota bacterium]
MRFSIYQESAQGGRPVNQDRMGYSFTRDSLLMVLADGMGGHPRGEVAARLAVQAAGAEFQQRARPRLHDPADFLRQAFMAAHRDILRYQALHSLPGAPRTTLVACVVQAGRAWWAHAGDSRCYWIRAGSVRRRTRDHSRVEQLIELGLLTPGEAARHPERHLVSNCLGGPLEPRIEVSADVELMIGDLLLLCSDGVWSAADEGSLCHRLGSGPVSDSVPRLVREAVDRAGAAADNATAIAMAWEGEPLRRATLPPLTLPDHAITTTIAHEPLDAAQVPEITDEEIERTIREIQAAIGHRRAR